MVSSLPVNSNIGLIVLSADGAAAEAVAGEVAGQLAGTQPRPGWPARRGRGERPAVARADRAGAPRAGDR
jgi:hypothetical protein